MTERPPSDPGEHAADLSRRYALDLDKVAGQVMIVAREVAEHEYGGDHELALIAGPETKFFSQNKITAFSDLCEASVDAPAALGESIQLAMRSPRELIRVLDTILREHDDQYAADANAPRLWRPHKIMSAM